LATPGQHKVATAAACCILQTLAMSAAAKAAVPVTVSMSLKDELGAKVDAVMAILLDDR
jgi:hypothetical protein